jgi:hypothetical protein
MTIRHSDLLKGRIMAATRDNHVSVDYSDTLKRTMDKHRDHHGYEHARWRDWRVDLREKHQAFAVVRNPWDRVASRYWFAKKVIEVEKKVPASYADVSSFEAFLEERHKWGGKRFFWHRAIRGWYPAFDYVSDATGRIQCHIIRFENLNNDLCAYFGLAEMTRARNVTAYGNGSQVYTDKTIQIVADWYAKDIDTWGYDFA